MNKIRVGVLGATGMVGQRFVTLLEGHPWFSITCLAASSRSAGMDFKTAVDGRWKIEVPMPGQLADYRVLDVQDVQTISKEVDLVFCALDLDKKAIQTATLARSSLNDICGLLSSRCFLTVAMLEPFRQDRCLWRWQNTATSFSRSNSPA